MRIHRKIRLKKLALVMVSMGLSLTLAACGGSSDAKAGSNQKKETNSVAPVGKDMLVVGNLGEVPTLDPGKWNDNTSLRVLHDLFEGLVGENQADEVVPAVATSWDESKDGLTYTFYLRKDAKWSNGEPVTAEDFVYAFKRNIDPTVGAQQIDVFRPIANGEAIIDGKKPADSLGVMALDSHTLQIKLDYAYPFFIDTLTNPVTYPLYKPVLDRWGDGWAQPGHMVSNGAYELKSWIVNGSLLEQKNPHYWDAKRVKIDKVKFLPVNPQAEYSQFLSGQIDMTNTVPSGVTKAQFEQKFGREFYNIPMLGTYYYWFNIKKPGVDKVDVRKALTMVVDRKAIVNSITRLGQLPLYGIMPINIENGSYKDLYKQLPSYDWVDWSMDKRIDKAKKLLIKSGYSAEHPLDIKISFNTLEGHKMIAEAVAQMWQKAFGNLVAVTLYNEEWKVYLQSLRDGNFQVGRMGGIATLNAANNFLDGLTCNHPANYSRFCDKQFDRYYQDGMHAVSLSEYNKNMIVATKIAMNDYVQIPIYNYTYSRLVKNYVGGYHPEKNYMDDVYSKWLYFKKAN